MPRHLVLPDDAPIVRIFGAGLPDTLPTPKPGDPPLSEEPLSEAEQERKLARNRKRALRARLRRAEKRKLLPRRVYVSSQRFGYWSDELEAKLEALPKSYAATLGDSAPDLEPAEARP